MTINFGKRENLLAALRWVSLAVILFAALIFIAGQVVGLSGLDTALRKISPATLGLILFATLAANTLRFYRWPFFVRLLKLQVPTPRLALYYIAGMALLPTPGKVGTALRLWLLHRHHGIAYKNSTPILLLDFITDALAMVLLVALSLPWFGNAAGLKLGLMLLLAIIGGLVLLFHYPEATQKLIALAQRATGGRGQKFFATLTQITTDLHLLVGPRNLAIATALSLAAWLGVVLAFAALLHNLGYGFNWPLVAFAMGGSMVLGALTLLPGGLGSSEVTLFAILLANGLSLADATVFTALLRLCTLWLPVLAGISALPFALRKR